jgi:penicillin-binding protein 1A
LYITKNKLRGASTIEQQFVRTITNDRSYTLLRKIREQRLAIVLGGYSNKKTIINSYLNIAYFGWKMNGITRACLRLGYDINSLNIDQISHLVAMLKYPMPRIPSLQRLKQIEHRKIFIKSCLLCQAG